MASTSCRSAGLAPRNPASNLATARRSGRDPDRSVIGTLEYRCRGSSTSTPRCPPCDGTEIGIGVADTGSTPALPSPGRALTRLNPRRLAQRAAPPGHQLRRCKVQTQSPRSDLCPVERLDGHGKRSRVPPMRRQVRGQDLPRGTAMPASARSCIAPVHPSGKRRQTGRSAAFVDGDRVCSPR
jgi:hypothetical protein